MKILLVLATILATVSAYCPNGCNKNGSCGLNGEIVRCYFTAYSLLLHSQYSSPLSSIIILQINAFVTIVQMETQRGLDMIAR